MHGSTYGLPAKLLAELTGVHMDTARRWKRDGYIPKHYQAIATLKLSGDLGQLSHHWAGFKIHQQELWTPEAQRITPGEIRAIKYRIEEIRELKRLLSNPKQQTLF